MRAMILAAGRGERMRPLTDILPKPLLPVGGKPLIVHHIEKLARAGVTEIIINHAWLGDKLVAALGDGTPWGVSIRWSAERDGGLETAGGIRRALPLLGDAPFLVVNGDIWLDADYGQFVEKDLAGDLGHLWLVDNPPQHPHGDFSLLGDRVINQPGLTFCGVALYRPAAFAIMAEGKAPLKPWFLRWMDEGRLGGSYLACEWHDIGTPERLAALDSQLQGRI
ncbi:MAG: nucleotidyltransferase family protein [Aeromonadaceae bacterium]|nr:nucleotidyltransferase family protein [Aeromonadaceae bacterium]